ncbi:hypothetical protein Scep_019494 [Stephania cephalantha]|uniref:Uncharacterized protein n=1 Tax=Stephania cephalantha TaxID=152367 RepID=A0AAP0IBA1_9MAGN
MGGGCGVERRSDRSSAWGWEGRRSAVGRARGSWRRRSIGEELETEEEIVETERKSEEEKRMNESGRVKLQLELQNFAILQAKILQFCGETVIQNIKIFQFYWPEFCNSAGQKFAILLAKILLQ